MTNLSGANLNNGAAVGPQGEGRDSPSRFPKYPAYKDSGVEWLGEVPEGWILARGDAYLRSQAKVVSADYLGGKEVFHYSIPAVQATGDGQLEDGDEIDSSKLLVEQPQVLISKLNPRKNTVCLAGPREVVTVCSGEFVPLQSDCMDLKWVYYLVSSENFKKRLESLVESATRSHQRVNPSDILKFRGAFPLLAEQTQIARFLDHETARIDALIEEQQRLIELLKEKRQAVISHAVTKGLDPTVPMKDSGVEWLGEVPAHWNVGTLRWYATIQGGVAKGKDYEGRETVVMPYLRVANVQNGYVDLAEVKEIAVLESEVERYRLRAGDVLMNEGGDNDKLGRGTVWQAQIDPCLHQNHVFAIRPNGLLRAEWLAAFTQAEQARTYFYLNSKQSTNLASISASNVMSLALPIPSEKEQLEILTYLEADRIRHEELTAVAVSTVELLQERRSALISAAVTGKIDVRGWQPPVSTQAPEFEVAEAV